MARNVNQEHESRIRNLQARYEAAGHVDLRPLAAEYRKQEKKEKPKKTDPLLARAMELGGVAILTTQEAERMMTFIAADGDLHLAKLKPEQCPPVYARLLEIGLIRRGGVTRFWELTEKGIAALPAA